MINAAPVSVLRFGPFEFDPATDELRRAGKPVDLRPQVSRLLGLLIRSRGQLVTRDEIRECLWEDGVVEFDQGINACVRELRQVLGDRASSPCYIETVPKRGYRFVALLEQVGAGAEMEPAQEDPRTTAPSRRFPRRELAALPLLLLLLLAAAWGMSEWMGGDEGRRHAPTLTVVPMQTNGNLTEERFGDALDEELAVVLGALPVGRVRVVPWHWGMGYDQAAGVITAGGKETEIDLFSEGYLRQVGAEFRVGLSLHRVEDGAMLWTESYTRPVADSAATKREIAGRVAEVVSQAVASRTPPL